MSNGWKVAGIGAIGGAILSLGLVAAWTWAGLMPANPNDKASDAATHRYLTAHPEELIAMSNAVQAQQDEADNHAHEVALKKMGLTALFDPKVAFVTGPALLIATRHHVAPAEPATSAMTARDTNFVVRLVPSRFILEVPFS